MTTETRLRFVVATTNRGKLAEISAVLGPSYDLTHLPKEFRPAPETGVSLEENAKLKATHAARRLDVPALADDTGLEIDALGGEPGVRSARYLGEDTSYQTRIEAILSRLRGVDVSDRRARFRTVAVAAFPDGTLLLESGILEGVIGYQPSGSAGFGYDSVFMPHGCRGRTLAELALEETVRISHRSLAFGRLLRPVATTRRWSV